LGDRSFKWHGGYSACREFLFTLIGHRIPRRFDTSVYIQAGNQAVQQPGSISRR